MDLIKNLVIKQMVSGITSALTGGGGLSVADAPSVSEATSFAGYESYATGFAKGGAMSSPSLSAYSNSVVSSPTPFYFASGGVPGMNEGIMGEAGIEAIFPVKEMSSGNLGVEGTMPSLKVNIYNNSNTEVTTETDEQGNLNIILDAVADSINRNTSGIRPAIENLIGER